MGNPLVAIVGRPNVGKSSLFNRLLGSPIAVVSELAGTTRDRISAETILGEHPMVLVDTGGLEPFPGSPLEEQVQAQARPVISPTSAAASGPIYIILISMSLFIYIIIF